MSSPIDYIFMKSLDNFVVIIINILSSYRKSIESWWEIPSWPLDDNTNHRGTRMVFLIRIRLISYKSSECWWWSRHNCREISWRCNRWVMTSVKRMMKRKVIGNIGTTQNQVQACGSRRNDMMRKIDVSLAQRRKLCSGNKDRVAQLKLALSW